MRKILAISAVAAVAGLSLATVPASAATSTSQVSVFHGVPGLTVDVYANGDVLLEDFKPGTITDPVTLPAGTYDLAVFPAGEGPDGTPAIEANDVAVPGGANITVAAHLNASGTPVLTPFVNDVSKVAAGKARLTVRHTAAAPAVDVLADGTAAFKGLVNPKEAKADLAAGEISAAVALAGTTDPVIGPADVNLAEGTNTIVFAWGSAADDNLALAVQTIKNLHSAPGGVPSGEGATPAGTTPIALGAVALIGLVAAGAALTRARRTTV